MQQLTQTNGAHQPTRPFGAPRAIYLQLADDITARISAGEWKPGNRLPNESDFARLYGTSQGTMRSTLNYLEGKGIVARRAGQGTFVLDKEANEAARRIACTQASLLIIQKASKEAGHSTTPELTTLLQTAISSALFDAGYSGEAP